MVERLHEVGEEVVKAGTATVANRRRQRVLAEIN